MRLHMGDEWLEDTPFVALHLDVLEANIRKMAELGRTLNVKLRPHIKTHKSTWIARKQLEAGAAGITVAKLGEAEVMAEAGIRDMLIACPIIGRRKLARLRELMRRADPIVALDEWSVAAGLNEVGESLNRRIPVYIDVETGYRRMGRNVEESVPIVTAIARLPYIEVRGLMSHTGHSIAEATEEGRRRVAVAAAETLGELQRRLRRAGVDVPEISVGSTPTASFTADAPGVTEIRPGAYVFYDRKYLRIGSATLDDCALTVVSTVIARPGPNHLVLDAGGKTLGFEVGNDGVNGLIIGHDGVILNRMNDEYGIAEIVGKTDLRVGDVVEIVPYHASSVVNLADELYGFRRGTFERVVRVDARGKTR
jgi:D-serine deaminase-like pyridoxal phosphate-dependent protein